MTYKGKRGMENHQLTAEEIIDEIKRVHSDRKLFEKIAGIISKEYYKYNLGPSTPADIMQEATLRILNGGRKVSREYKFSDIFIYVSISVMRDLSRKNSIKQTEKVELEDREEEYELVEETTNPKEISSFTEHLSVEPTQYKQIEKEEMAEYIHKACDSDNLSIRVFELRLEGYSNKEIAKKCKASVEEIEKALNRLRTKGKKFRSHT